MVSGTGSLSSERACASDIASQLRVGGKDDVGALSGARKGKGIG